MSSQESTVKIHYNGNKEWRRPNNQVHRVGGPAIELADDTKIWYQNGRLHRIGGPAMEYPDGYKAWYQNGKRHRVDGPAIQFADGRKAWYLSGEEFTEEEYNKQVALIY